jgi:pimeloyl-ACP methyl ester carboxylesterase
MQPADSAEAQTLMTHGRLITLATLIALAISGCSRNTEPATPATSAPSASNDSASSDSTGTPSQQQTQSADGSPKIVTEPDGVHIEYRTYGTGDPAIILIHGWATDANYWNAQVGPLKAKYTVVAVDLAGHGASSNNRTAWSMENYGEDVAVVARQLPNQQLILVGHSMGGTIALEAAKRIGDRVIGIIAVDALKSVGLPPTPRGEIEKRVAPFRTDFIGSVRKYVTDELFEKGADPVFVQKVAYDMSLEPAEVAIPSLEALLSMDFATVLPDIHVPVMAINSDMGATDEKRIRKSLPGFKAEVIPHTSHFLMMEAPDKFNPILLDDIDALVKKARR